MSWSDDLQKLADTGKADLGTLCRKVKIDLFSDAIVGTRVDTGRLKGNWQIQENTPAGVSIDRIDPTGTKVLADVNRKATEDGLTYFTNHLPYAKVWEERDAMVGRAVSRVRQIVRNQVKALK